jgi:hypothetical protein
VIRLRTYKIPCDHCWESGLSGCPTCDGSREDCGTCQGLGCVLCALCGGEREIVVAASLMGSA